MTQKLANQDKKGANEVLSQSMRVQSEKLEDEQSADKMSSTQHQQNLKKRKQKKGGNLSIHKFDEATKRSIEDAVRQNLNESGEENL